jgi:hypothetical protein
MIAVQQHVLDFDVNSELTTTAAAEDAPLTARGDAEASVPSVASLSVSYIHPTLGPVYVAPEAYRDERGRWHSVMGEPPVRWLTFSAEGDACGEGR